MSARLRLPIAFAAFVLLAPSSWLMVRSEAAGPYDGSRPFLCAVASVMECDNSGKCERHINEEGDVTFVRVDVGAKTLTAGPTRKTSLRSASNIEGQLILQGGENGRGWSVTVHEESGRMAAAIIDNDVVFSIFGGCTIP